MPITIRRGFLDLPDRQVHYRTAGEGAPLLLLHSSPGSARQLEPLIARLAPHFRVIAPDTPGNGDSPALDLAEPTIADYAARLCEVLDALGLDRVDVYGSHTGASIAAELAIAAPARVGKLILDGVGVFTPEQRDENLRVYALPFVPDLDGAYLLRAFLFCRDQYLFWPWHARSRAARRDAGLPPAATLHAWLLEVLKAAETYPLAYRAAFRWDALVRLPLIDRPALAMAAADDPLFACTRDSARLIPGNRFVALPRYDAAGFAELQLSAILAFLGD